MHKKTPESEFLFNKVAGLQLYQKEAPAQVFSCEYRGIYKNTYFEKHLRAFRIFSAVKSAYGGEIFFSDIFWSTLFMLGNYNTIALRTLSNT